MRCYDCNKFVGMEPSAEVNGAEFMFGDVHIELEVEAQCEVCNVPLLSKTEEVMFTVPPVDISQHCAAVAVEAELKDIEEEREGRQVRYRYRINYTLKCAGCGHTFLDGTHEDVVYRSEMDEC